MKRFLILLLSLTVLSGCVFTNVSTPAPVPASVLQTAVALTLTAQPTVTPATLTPAVVSQVGTETATPAEAPTLALPTPTVTPTAMPTAVLTAAPAVPVAPAYSAPILQTPDQFIRTYYSNINVANYAYTWSLLTANFIAANNGPATGGYAGYVSFWNTIHEVVVQNVYVSSQSGGYAVVTVSALYHYNDGSLVTTSVAFNLTYNYSRGTWMFDSPYSSYYAPVTTLQTPVQFIFTYFYYINVYNYAYTWSLLTPLFISHNNPDGYSGYVSYWNSVQNVSVQNVYVSSQSGAYAVVVVSAYYYYTSGTYIYNTQTYNLTYDYSRGTWMFDSPY
jgi:hypothetical protein